ncbi:Three prime repair exonuclease 2 [Frankliniella fusca]|uniref:Three prime repair exonuclease 2 n=1 Tax=Frankliniella fusca TaxID=407009 RepID=A0AAE1HHM8_9NEOP|nr:Three prime repair exonuclease 2 [Frankliniella fusca]
METFKSLVIMDLESSGLPSSVGKTKITELSFIGVLVPHILSCHKTQETVPRVLQKLNLCFYPHKRIDFEATEITGLDNFLLEEIPVFNREAGEMLISFLERMPPPVCLVAHNGLKFDFPLLKAELSAKSQSLPDSILCADSLLGFRALHPTTISSPSFSRSPPQTVRGIQHLDSAQEASDSTFIRTESVECVSMCSQAPDTSTSSGPDTVLSKDMQKANETTPKQKILINPSLPLKRKIMQANENNENLNVRNGGIRKKLFRGQDKLVSHKLVDLYRFIVGREQRSGHHAENDTIALLECIVTAAPEFLKWIGENHLSFTKVPCMW